VIIGVYWILSLLIVTLKATGDHVRDGSANISKTI